MIPEGIDGQNHINIYSKGKTLLGKWLTNFAYSPITIPEHGKFASIEAYWYWLSCEDDNLRHLNGFTAKQEGKRILSSRCDGLLYQRDNFNELICKAIDIKLKSNMDMLYELHDSTLPLVHYYEYGGKRVDAGYEWIVDHIESRRQLLKEKWLK
jgi:hypothetical protein